MTTDEIETVHVEEIMTSEESCFISRKHLDANCKARNIQRRPNAGDGLWLCSLVPLALLINAWTHPKSSTYLYRASGYISIGLFLQSVDIIFKLSCRRVYFLFNVTTIVLPGIVSSLLIWFLINIDPIFSFSSGLLCCLIFNFFYIFLLKRLPRSFTLGEAAIVTQGVIIILFGAVVNILELIHHLPNQPLKEMSLILSVAFLGLFLVILLVYGISFCRKTLVFLTLIASWILLTGFAPVTDPLPAILVVTFIFLDIGRVLVLLIYGGIAAITGAFVAWKISKKSSTSVSIRKVFHIVIVFVYLIGIIFQCTMLYLLSGLVLGLFLVCETVRLIDFPMISQHLDAIVGAFVDEKDAGLIALTPVYLLVGCSSPLWLHPAPCDLTDSSTFTLLPLIAGVLSVGIGDTMAGVIGSKVGRHRLANSEKTIEGTLANIVSQIATIFFLHFIGYLSLNFSSIIISFVGVTTNAILEAKTDQVDNLFLPLVTFSIFSIHI